MIVNMQISELYFTCGEAKCLDQVPSYLLFIYT